MFVFTIKLCLMVKTKNIACKHKKSQNCTCLKLSNQYRIKKKFDFIDFFFMMLE